MTANLALRKASPLEPGEFRFITKAMQIEPPGEGGKRRFKTIASSTIKDMGGDEMKLSALEDMAASFRAGLNIFTDHKHEVDKVFGRSDQADIRDSGERDEKTGSPIYDLHIAGVVNEPDPRAVQLADSIDGGYVTFGASIGAIVREHQRNKSGGMDIYHVDAKEASLVGIPMNQRSWTYKAAKAAELLDQQGDDLDDDDEEPEAEKALDTTEGAALQRQDLEKATLSGKKRSSLADSQFACPEKRKYPIHDAAHVRAALSRVGDPSNDQCGRDKIIAAARRMGIGDHKTLTDDELATWAATEFPADQITEEETFIIKTDDPAAEPETDEAATEPTVDADVQESEPETPETTDAATDDEADTPDAEKALVFETTDVVELALKARGLAQAVTDRDEQIATLKAENGRLTEANGEMEQAIEKLMAMPLRAKTAVVTDLQRRLPDFLAPEVKNFLNKTAGDNQ